MSSFEDVWKILVHHGVPVEGRREIQALWDQREALNLRMQAVEIAKIALQPDDTLVAMFQERLSADRAEKVSIFLRELHDGPTAIIDGGGKLAVLRPQEADGG